MSFPESCQAFLGGDGGHHAAKGAVLGFGSLLHLELIPDLEDVKRLYHEPRGSPDKEAGRGRVVELQVAALLVVWTVANSVGHVDLLTIKGSSFVANSS